LSAKKAAIMMRTICIDQDFLVQNFLQDIYLLMNTLKCCKSCL